MTKPTIPRQFRNEAANHARHALKVAAEIMHNEELSPAVRLEAGKWLTKIADLEPKSNSTLGDDKFCIVINFVANEQIIGKAHEAGTALDNLLEPI